MDVGLQPVCRKEQATVLFLSWASRDSNRLASGRPTMPSVITTKPINKGKQNYYTTSTIPSVLTAKPVNIDNHTIIIGLPYCQ